MDSIADEETYRKRFARHTTASYTSALLIKVMGLVLTKILTVFLTKSDYGIYILWMSLAFLLLSISTSPFNASLWRYLQKKRLKAPDDASRLITLCIAAPIIIIAVIFGISFICYILFGIRIVEDPFYMLSLFTTEVLTVFLILKELILVISGSEQNSREILTFSLTFSFASITVASIIAILFQNLQLVIAGWCVGYSVPVLIVLTQKLKQYRLRRFETQELRLVTEYGGPLLIVSSSQYAVSFLTSFAVSIWFGLSGVGTLYIAQVLAMLLSVLVMPSLVAYRTYMVMMFDLSDFEIGNRLTTKLVELFISLITPAVWLTIAFSPLLITIVSTAEYLDAIILIPFTLAATAILSLSQFWLIRIQLVQKNHLAAGVYILSLTILIVSMLFLQQFGIIGIGFAILLHAVTVLVGLSIMGNKDNPIKLNLFYFISWTISLIILVLLDLLLRKIGFSAMFASILASSAYFICLIATRGLKLHEVKKIIQTMLNRT